MPRKCHHYRLTILDQPTASWGRDTEHKEPQQNSSKATSSMPLFLSKMIAKLERVPRTTSQNKDPTQNSRTQWEQQQQQQWLNNIRIIALERTAA